MINPETGICPACSQINLRTHNFCSFCGFKLPWADSVDLLAAGVSTAGANAAGSSPITSPLPPPLPPHLPTAGAQQTAMRPGSASPQLATSAQTTGAAPVQGLVQTHRKAEGWGGAIMVLGAFITGLAAFVLAASAMTDPAALEAARAAEKIPVDKTITVLVLGLTVFIIGGVTYHCAKWSPPRMVPPAKKKPFVQDVAIKTLLIFIGLILISILDRP